MTHMPYPPRRFAHGLGWTFIALVLSAAVAAAAPPPGAEVAKPATRAMQVQAEPAAHHQQAAQEVSDALGQRLNQMMGDLKTTPPR
jgi:hypothetical protein